MDFARAEELIAKLNAAGIAATCDPRAAIPPCVLAQYPHRRYDLSFCDAYTAEWEWHILAPATATADAWRLLDDLADQFAAVHKPQRMDRAAYRPSADSPALPAYRVTFEEPITSTPEEP